MAEEYSNEQPDYGFDVNTRIRDIEEQNKITRERNLILSQNLISFKEEISEDIKQIKKTIQIFQEDINKLKSVSNALINETGKYSKKDEMMIIERMLKDFQPLEFLRKKDIEELIEEKLKTHKRNK